MRTENAHTGRILLDDSGALGNQLVEDLAKGNQPAASQKIQQACSFQSDPDIRRR